MRTYAVCIFLLLMLTIPAIGQDSLITEEIGEDYTIHIEYPELVEEYPFVREAIDNALIPIETEFLDIAEEHIDEVAPYALDIRAETTAFSEDIQSVLLNIYSYTGGAHGNTYFRTFVFDLPNQQEITLADMFINDLDPLPIISPLVRDTLYTRIGYDEWVTDGTEPTPENYANFTLDADNIVIHFPAYQVGPYALGPQEVRIPFMHVYDMLTQPYADRVDENRTQEFGDEYIIGVTYPDALNDNAFMQTVVTSFVDEERARFLDTVEEAGEDAVTIPWQLFIEASETGFSDTIRSVKLDIHSYTGGAHGNTTYQTFVLDLENQRVLSLNDIFIDEVNALEILAGLVPPELHYKLELLDALDEEWLAQGTAATPENYQNFIVTPEGISIYIPAYQVAPYAVGPQEVHLPYYMYLESLAEPFASVYEG